MTAKSLETILTHKLTKKFNTGAHTLSVLRSKNHA